jgi:hypothetical protein
MVVHNSSQRIEVKNRKVSMMADWESGKYGSDVSIARYSKPALTSVNSLKE